MPFFPAAMQVLPIFFQHPKKDVNYFEVTILLVFSLNFWRRKMLFQIADFKVQFDLYNECNYYEKIFIWKIFTYRIVI